MGHQITDLNETDKTWLSSSLATGRQIVMALTGKDRREMDSLYLDNAFQAWAKKPDQFSNEDIANGLGALFGEMLKESFALNWKMIEDDYGQEPALIDDTTGSVIFPINTVWKRIEPQIKNEEFFVLMWQTIEKHLQQLKK